MEPGQIIDKGERCILIREGDINFNKCMYERQQGKIKIPQKISFYKTLAALL